MAIPFCIKDLQQRIQIRVPDGVLDVRWDARNKRVVTMQDDSFWTLTSFVCDPETGENKPKAQADILLCDVLTSLGYNEHTAEFEMDWIDIAGISLGRCKGFALTRHVMISDPLLAQCTVRVV